jgi:hypothetical protein
MAQAKKREPRRCEHKGCTWNTVGTSHFCNKHAPPGLKGAAAVEADALGPEAAAALRQDLGVPVPAVVESQPEEEESVMVEEREDDEQVPEEAKRDPVRYAMGIVAAKVAAAQAAENRERGDARQQMTATDQARMWLNAYMPELDDPAAMVGESGKPLVKEGWIGRWVRDKDEDGRPNTRRLRSFLAAGAEEVLNEDGRPLIGRLGRAIQMPPGMYAARVLRNSPSGAFDDNELVKNYQGMAEEMNRKMGRHIVDVRPGRDHGSRRGDF